MHTNITWYSAASMRSLAVVMRDSYGGMLLWGRKEEAMFAQVCENTVLKLSDVNIRNLRGC